MRSALGSIQRVSRDRYRVSVEGPRADDGSRPRRSRTVRGTRAQAEAALAALRLESGMPAGDVDLTLAEYWDAFYWPSVQRLAPKTRQGYENAWTAHVRPLLGDRAMRSLKAREIERALLTIERPGAQRNAFKLLRQMYNEAYRDEIVDDNPMTRRIRLDRMERYEPDVLLLPDVAEWASALRGHPCEPIAIVMLFAGLRREEACALHWSDFAWGAAACSARVERALVEVGGRKVHGPVKTPASRRTVYLSGWPFERLRDIASVGPLWPDATGDNMAPDKVAKEYRRALESAGARYVPMRNLRNSYATIMQGLGASDSLISKSLGHTNLAVDYAHYFAANAPAHMANAAMLGAAVGRVVDPARALGSNEM